jgi:chromosome segregation ATPase
VVGGGRYRLHEELISAGGFLTYGERPSFRRMGVTELNNALEAMRDTLPDESILQSLPRHWESFAPALRNALDARMNDRLETIRKQLDERMETEAKDIQAILEELGRSIQKELNSPEILQPMLPGFSPTEHEQYQRDVDALRQRLARIPQEIAQEQQSLRNRYADFQARLFPVAITYLVPEHLG